MNGLRKMVCCGILLAAGCGSQAVKPPAAPAANAGESSATPETDSEAAPTEEQVAVHIEDAIKKACGISDTRAYFAFDSSNLESSASGALGQLAHCFSKGPLGKERMRLVGYADPRGESEYNLVLGGERASSVKSFLVRTGVAAERIETTSRGEMEAKGHDEATWAKDRRVDVRLAN